MHDANTDPLVRVATSTSVPDRQGHLFEAVKGISFDIPTNPTVALVGESGSGKTVTSIAILGLLPPENSIVAPASEILYDGNESRDGSTRPTLRDLRGEDISVIFQEPMTSLNPVFTVGEQTEVLRLHMGIGRQRRASARSSC